MNMREEVTFSRNADAVTIPNGERVLVPIGSIATITQSLGGSYTLITDRGSATPGTPPGPTTGPQVTFGASLSGGTLTIDHLVLNNRTGTAGFTVFKTPESATSSKITLTTA